VLAKVLASDSIESVCGEVFKARGHELVEKPGIKKDELLKIIHEYEGLVVRSGTKVTKEIIEAGVNLKIIGRAGTGVDNIDVPAATSKGILVVNTPGGNTISTGELALTHILALARNIPQATAALKAGRWDRAKYTGTELAGKVLGVIGVGRIGREVAKWCRGFGMTTIGYDPVLSEDSARSYGIDPVALVELLDKADFITIHTPLTKETHNLFNTESLKKCKQGVRIINCARGGIIDEKALLEAIKSGHVAGASLDTFEVEPPTADSLELRMHPHVIVSPHLGASTVDAQLRVAKAVAVNMSDIFDGGDFVGVVNAPDLGSVLKKTSLVPYVMLAEKIGSIQGQLLKQNKISSLTVTLRGEDVADSTISDVIKSAVIKGALSEIVSQPITYINAISVAEELGLRVFVNMSKKTEGGSGFMNSVSVELQLEGFLNMSRTIEGTVLGRNELRITSIDGYSVDLPPGENMLMFNNVDQPGVFLKIVQKLSAENVNVAHMTTGRVAGKKFSIGALVIDTPVSEDLMKYLSSVPELSNVVQVHTASLVNSTHIHI
jgi:D-3-phosphoglycerate dehydrogenase